MEENKTKEMTAEIVDVEWRRMPHRFDMSSRAERFALLMLLAEVAEYAGYLRDFAITYYGAEAAEGVDDFFALVHRELHGRASRELPVNPVEVVRFDPVDAWFEAADREDANEEG